MESLTSGVEPFILCAEFLNVDISKIAVMATLTVNLLYPCNVISSVALFHFSARRPALGYGVLVNSERSRQEEGLSLSSRGGMGTRALLCGSPGSVLLHRTGLSARGQGQGQGSAGHENRHQ